MYLYPKRLPGQECNRMSVFDLDAFVDGNANHQLKDATVTMVDDAVVDR
jgi:hypothetical protein